jgi:hypothetical protein
MKPRIAASTVTPVEVDEYARIAAAEDDHWWYRNTRALARDLLGPWLTQYPRILDAGCGPGGNGASYRPRRSPTSGRADHKWCPYAPASKRSLS